MDELSPAYLRSLPLHAVTEVYGEPGLRRRLELELEALADTGVDRVPIDRAFALADRLHRADRRVREPVVNHLLRVTLRILCHYRIRDVDVLVAALLHDAVEDHPAELAGGSPLDPTAAALGVIARDFGTRVAAVVEAVTNPEYDPDRDKDEQYREHVADSLAASPWARVVKFSDFTDNGVGILYTTGPKVRRAAVKYGPLVPVLRELLDLPDTPLAPDVRRHVAAQFDLAESRFAAILQPTS
ncbi:HD domain-containing protein [Pseudonocardia humida]|uniref:HD domain-containing protein n=1 Tax=Pseudonocardia humida TaxID=2800819 RepID=A0ABT1AAM1_9PSEU|nr:HD domain-containing protein [Pseudonocardia humida]MCO1659996.1 HD domain-containing protein [Pseudonocardia humida]